MDIRSKRCVGNKCVWGGYRGFMLADQAFTGIMTIPCMAFATVHLYLCIMSGVFSTMSTRLTSAALQTYNLLFRSISHSDSLDDRVPHVLWTEVCGVDG